jgi:arylsulfatase A-like enzyme
MGLPTTIATATGIAAATQASLSDRIINPGTQLSGVTLSSPVEVGRDPTPYNVVVILMDDTGRDQFDWHGLQSDYAATPRMNELRALGVTFMDAHAAPICGPTRAGIQTGVYAKTHGQGANILDGDTTFRLNDDLTFIPEAFKAGRPHSVYALGAFGKWHMCGYGQNDHPFTNGYNRYFGCLLNITANPLSSVSHYRWRKTTGTSTFTLVPSGWAPGGSYTYPDGLVYDSTTYDMCHNFRDAVQWINSRTQPFWCYIAPNPPHAPWERPPNTMPDDVGYSPPGGTIQLVPTTRQTELDGLGVAVGAVFNEDVAKRKSIWRAGIECLDTMIGWFWDRMDPAIRANTVFIVWGDNGTVAQLIESPWDSGHGKRSVYEQGVWVPGFVWGPPAIVGSPGRECNAMVSSTDIPRTIADICNIDMALVDPSFAADSISFLPLLRDADAVGERDEIYSELFDPIGGPPNVATWARALKRRYDGVLWKLIRNGTAGVKFFCVDPAVTGWQSSLPAVMEINDPDHPELSDDYYPTITTTAPAAAKAAYADLSVRLSAKEASAL